MEAPFVQTSQRSLLRKDTVKTPYGRKTDAKWCKMFANAFCWAAFSGAEAAYQLHHPLEPHRHLLCLQPASTKNVTSSVEKSLLISRSLILDIRWIFRRLLCNEKFSGLDDSGSSTLSLQCSERLFSRLGALHHAIEALWTANQNQVPNFFKFFKFGKWCAVGHIGKVAPTFLDICVGSAEAILHTASERPGHGQLPRLSGRLPRPQTAGRPGADQGTLPKTSGVLRRESQTAMVSNHREVMVFSESFSWKFYSRNLFRADRKSVV